MEINVRSACRFAGALAVLVAGLAVPAAPAVQAAAPPDAVITYESPTTRQWTLDADGPHLTPSAMEPGTSPAVARLFPGGVEMAFVASSGLLWQVDPGGNGRSSGTGLPVAGGTSPSIAAGADPDWEIAFQGGDGHLWTVDSGGRQFQSPFTMAPGSSPVVVYSFATRFEVFFAGLDGRLYQMDQFDNASQVPGAPGVAADTSPAAAVDPSDDVQVTYQADDTRQVVLDPGRVPVETPSALEPGTSPAITALPGGGFEMAFVASDQFLWQVSPQGSGQRAGNGLMAAPGTSPAIAADASGGWQIAFHSLGENALWVVNSNGTQADTKLLMIGASSPAISAPVAVNTDTLTGTVTFQSPQGFQWTYDSAGPVATPSSMAPGTNPAIQRDSGTSNEMAFVASNAVLWEVPPTGNGHPAGNGAPLLVAPGTSPALARGITGGWEIAFQSTAGTLCLLLGDGSLIDTKEPMEPGTSPAIAIPSSGAGHVIPFVKPDGTLRLLELSVTDDDRVFFTTSDVPGAPKVAAGTSPAIAADTTGGWKLTFQADSSRQWTYDSGNNLLQTPSALAPGTSPAITGLSTGGYEMAFVSSAGVLWQVAPDGNGHSSGTPSPLPVAPGTSPAIAAGASGSWQIAYQGRDSGSLILVGSDGLQFDTGVAMAPRTSPAISHPVVGVLP
jgi:hypothetical protein